MKRPVRIAHFLRQPRQGAHSIERLHLDIRDALDSEFEFIISTCTRPSKGILPRLIDMVLARRVRADVYHVTGDVHFLTLLLPRKRTVLTINDMVSLERLVGLKRWILWLIWYWLPVKISAKIVVISESTKKELLKYVSCDDRKIVVIHCPVSKEFEPSPLPALSSQPRILQIGTSPNKNIFRVVESLSGIPCTLVIIGVLSDDHIEHLSRYGVRYENLVELSRDDLRKQYELSNVVVFASTYEGFGLPIIEAQAMGRPVITSNLLSMPEVAGAGAIVVNPFDAGSIRRALEEVLYGDGVAERLVSLGLENVKRFDLEFIGAAYSRMYLSLIHADS